MAKQTLVTDSRLGHNTPSGDPRASVSAGQAVDYSVVHPAVGGSVDSVRTEINDAFEHMTQFHNMEPDEIMRLASGYSARLSFIRVRIMRCEDWAREWRNVRTREIEPCIDELREQWKNASRLQSVRELDWKMEAGER